MRGLKDLEGISPILYKWNEKSGYETEHTYAGFSAQNVQKSIPEAIGKDQKGYLSLDDRPIIATVVNAIKDQQKQIDQLKTEIDALKEQNELLKKTLSKIDLSSMKAAVGEKL